MENGILIFEGVKYEAKYEVMSRGGTRQIQFFEKRSLLNRLKKAVTREPWSARSIDIETLEFDGSTGLYYIIKNA